MRIANRLFLLALTVAAMTFTASAASAQVDVSEEPGEVCSEVFEGPDDSAVGGCPVHIDSVQSTHSGSHQIVLRNNGMVASICTIEATANIGGDGFGLITNQVLTGPTPPCVVRPCYEVPSADTGREVWPLQIHEVGGLLAEIVFCFHPFNSEVNIADCSVIVPVTEVTTHRYRFELADAECNADLPNDTRELSGALETEGSSIEIEH